VKNLLVLQAEDVENKRANKMEQDKSFDLEPMYSTTHIPGKCVKCLAEKELNDCLMKLLSEESEDPKAKEKFEMLVAFLQSPESQKLLDESEELLSDGKQVKIMVNFMDGKVGYEIEIL
jgi:hypothetical protein